jgi:hypothetical protein
MALEGIIQNQSQAVTQADIKKFGSDPKAMAQTFFNAMRDIMHVYGDRDAELVVDGIKVKPEDKYNVIGTTLINQSLEQSNNALETVINIEQFMIKMEQDISKVGG